MPTKTAPKSKSTESVERKVKHPKLRSVWHVRPDRKVDPASERGAPLTEAQVKDILGWEELADDAKGGLPELKALFNLNVKLHNNTKNRPIIPSWVLTLSQEHLRTRWRLNGESIVIGTTGLTLSGQHRCLGFLHAEHQRKMKAHWRDLLPEPLVMETLLVYGIEEDDDTFKTLNCGKPSTLDEVLFRSDVFGKLRPNERRTCTRMTAYAIKLLWDRTGAKDDPFAPRRTHGESIDFLARHPRILRSVKHIFEENKVQKDDEGRALPAPIGRFVSPGYASAMLYLMGSSSSDGGKYEIADPPSESSLDWDNWDKACEFWTLLGAGSPDLKPLATAIGMLADADTGAAGGSREEKLGLVCKAWEKFVAGHKLVASDLELEYDDDHALVHTYSVGGIDLGQPRKRKSAEEKPDDDQEEVEARKAKEREAKLDKKKGDKPRARPQTRKEIEAANTAAAMKADEELAASAVVEAVAAE
jgi:hypothetical protein